MGNFIWAKFSGFDKVGPGFTQKAFNLDKIDRRFMQKVFNLTPNQVDVAGNLPGPRST